jgi:hypothetical protein
MSKREKNMHVGIAHLIDDEAHQQEPHSREGNPRVEQHARQQVGVLVRLDHEKIPLNITRGQNEIWELFKRDQVEGGSAHISSRHR